MKKSGSKQRLFEVMSRLDKTFKPKLNENFEEPEEFIPHGSYTVSNTGGYEIMLNSAGDAARVRDAFGSDNPRTSDWLEIEYVHDDDTGEDEPIIDPNGYNIPLNQVMRNNSGRQNENIHNTPQMGDILNTGGRNNNDNYNKPTTDSNENYGDQKSKILESIDRPLNKYVKDLQISIEYSGEEKEDFSFKVFFDVNNLPNGYDVETAKSTLMDNLNYYDAHGAGAYYSKCRATVIVKINIIIVSGSFTGGYDV